MISTCQVGQTCPEVYLKVGSRPDVPLEKWGPEGGEGDG